MLGGDAPGEGARQMLDALDVGRVNVACRALGILDRCLACAVEESTTREVGDGLLGDHTHAQLRVGELVARRAAVEALVERAAAAVDARADDARELSTAAKVVASDTAVWAVDRRRPAGRLSRSYAAGDELARLRRDAPQTQIGEGANDALLLALARPLLPASRAASLEAREPVVGERLPVRRGGDPRVPLRADAGVAVDRAEADDDERAAGLAAGDVAAALAAEGLRQAVLGLPGAHGVLALREREAVAGDDRVLAQSAPLRRWQRLQWQ